MIAATAAVDGLTVVTRHVEDLELLDVAPIDPWDDARTNGHDSTRDAAPNCSSSISSPMHARR